MAQWVGRLLIILAIGPMIGLFASAQNEAEEEIWRAVPDENLLVFELTTGTVIVELAENFAPGHTSRIRNMVEAGVLNGTSFYRVIDGFVAQGGLNDDDQTDWPDLKNENDRALFQEGFVPFGNGDLYAPEVGHIGGFAAARDEELELEWLLHCPGALAMARNTDPDTGSTDFYFTLAPQRYLDRNLTVFGRVLDGMEHLQKLERGDRNVDSGVMDPVPEANTIKSVRLASTIVAEDRPAYQVMRVDSDAFESNKLGRRIRTAEFFYRKPPHVLDICSYIVPVKAVAD
ncbi:MAG: peptidylprolyl isomerase [Pseudomonadota bacterium]